MTAVPSKFIKDNAVNLQDLVKSYGELGGDIRPHIAQDGRVDVESLGAAYSELERQRSKPAGNPSPSPALVLDVSQPATPAAVDWGGVTRELQQKGDLSPATRQRLRGAGIDEGLVDQYIAGHRAMQENAIIRMAGTVGGIEEYNAVIEWANQALPVEQRRALQSQISQPGGEMALLGLHQMYVKATGGRQAAQAAQAGKRDVPVFNTAGGGGGGGSTTGARPFETKDERRAAFRDPRYITDLNYREEVHARARATADMVAQAQIAHPVPGIKQRHSRSGF